MVSHYVNLIHHDNVFILACYLVYFSMIPKYFLFRANRQKMDQGIFVDAENAYSV